MSHRMEQFHMVIHTVVTQKNKKTTTSVLPVVFGPELEKLVQWRRGWIVSWSYPIDLFSRAVARRTQLPLQ